MSAIGLKPVLASHSTETVSVIFMSLMRETGLSNTEIMSVVLKMVRATHEEGG
jgi:hypothetical protein